MRHLLSLVVLLLALVLPWHASAQSDCGWNPDYNGDNTVGVVDLLGLLGVFSQQDIDNDGIWDSQDDCIGVEDECGICNGPGPDVPVIEDIVVLFDSTYIEANDSWQVYEIGADTTFSYVCATPGCTNPEAGNFNPEAVIDDGSCVDGPEACGGSTTIEFAGYTYDLVAIGDQCWFAENLRAEHYANGDAIPSNLSDSEWTTTTSGAQTVYGEGSSAVYAGSDDEVANLANYGRLYNWYAVDDARGICPSGWHVPTDGEWMTLEMELGMSSSEANSTGWRGTNQGAQMKSSSSDSPNWNGTNVSGFSALPGGWRYNLGYFNGGQSSAVWWSATPGGALGVWGRRLDSDNGDVNRSGGNARSGHAVRCLGD